MPGLVLSTFFNEINSELLIVIFKIMFTKWWHLLF